MEQFIYQRQQFIYVLSSYRNKILMNCKKIKCLFIINKSAQILNLLFFMWRNYEIYIYWCLMSSILKSCKEKEMFLWIILCKIIFLIIFCTKKVFHLWNVVQGIYPFCTRLNLYIFFIHFCKPVRNVYNKKASNKEIYIDLFVDYAFRSILNFEQQFINL